MKERLPIAISVAALVVAVLGSTGLGEAAQNGVAAGASKAKRATGLGAKKSSARRGPRGPRGYRGYRGYRGLRGFQGPPGDKGDKGDKGDVGPSEALDRRSTTPVTLSGPDEHEINSLDIPSVPPYDRYVATAVVTIQGTGDGTVNCWLREGIYGPNAGAHSRTQIGDVAGASRIGTITLTTGIALNTGSGIHLRCSEVDGTADDPVVVRSHLSAIKVGSLSFIVP